MKEKFERFKNEKIVINVRSSKQYDDFMKMCEEQGLKWSSEDLPTTINHYNFYKEETCINLNYLKKLSYSDIDFFKNEGYKIITYKDFMKEDEPIEKILLNYQDGHSQEAINEYLRCKINELIDEVNKLKKESDK